MESTSVIGYIAAVFTTFSLLPQVIQAWKSKSTKDISLKMYLMFFFGIILWLIYGLMLGEMPIILANAIALILSAAILVLKIRYG